MAVAGLVIVGEVRSVETRRREADKEGKPRNDVVTVRVLGETEFFETWGEDNGGWQKGDQVAFLAQATLPNGASGGRISYRRLRSLPAQELVDQAKIMVGKA